jgi:hypothetical protein
MQGKILPVLPVLHNFKGALSRKNFFPDVGDLGFQAIVGMNPVQDGQNLCNQPGFARGDTGFAYT